MDRGDELEERMTAATEPQARLTVLTRAVATRVARAPAPEPAVRAAARALREPRTRITGLPERLGLSERHLRRRFEVGVGYSPTTLARVLRLQRFLALARHGDLARLAADAGYGDPPHLAHDCRRLTGLPPSALLANSPRPAGERFTAA